jgi:hypothetical protein
MVAMSIINNNNVSIIEMASIMKAINVSMKMAAWRNVVINNNNGLANNV